jgi:hypothetical protein
MGLRGVTALAWACLQASLSGSLGETAWPEHLPGWLDRATASLLANLIAGQPCDCLHASGSCI